MDGSEQNGPRFRRLFSHRVIAAAQGNRDGGKPQLQWVLARKALLAAVVPALVVDSPGRALHDRASGLATLRTR